MKILLAGEAWLKNVTDYKGTDFTTSGFYEESERWIRKALERERVDVVYMPTLAAQRDFPDGLSPTTGVGFPGDSTAEPGSGKRSS